MVEQLLSARNSLRRRFIIGMGIMLLPMAVLVISSFVGLQRTVGALEQVVEDPVEEILLTQALQNRILRTGFPFHHYVTHNKAAAKEEYLRLTLEVDEAFERALAFEYLIPEERDLLLQAREEWTAARAVADGVLEKMGTVDHHNEAFAQSLDDFGNRLGNAVRHLDKFTDMALAEIDAQRNSAHAVEYRAELFVLVIFSLGFVVAVTAAVALARSVLSPIHKLKKSVNRFGDSDLTDDAKAEREDELGTLASAFHGMASKLERVQKELEYLSTHDALTGLCDRKRFHEVLSQEMQRSLRYGHTFALLLIDVDSFKEVNLTFGRLVGDSVLCTVASEIANSVRPTDLASRYRSEEVAIILSETTMEGALDTAERIRRTLADKPLNVGDGRVISITASIGVAVFPEDADNDVELFDMADNALHRAKTLGRNRVCYASEIRNQAG